MDRLDDRRRSLDHFQFGSQMLYVTQQDCENAGISANDIYHIVESALLLHGRKQAETAPKTEIQPRKQTFHQAMLACVPSENICGLKWESQSRSVLILNELNTGVPIALLDGKWLTRVKNAALTMIGVTFLANRKAETFGMIGCRGEVKEHVSQIVNYLPHLRRIHLYDSYLQQRHPILDELQSQIDVEIIQCLSLEELVLKSEVISSSLLTFNENQTQIQVGDEWISSGQTLLQNDTFSLYENKTLLRADKYIVDSIDHLDLWAEIEYDTHSQPVIYGEMGDIVAGIKKGREDENEVIINQNKGMALLDIVLGKAIFDCCLEQKLGQRISVP